MPRPTPPPSANAGTMERLLQKITYITPDGRKNLLRYKYRAEDNSLISIHLLQPLWNFLINRFPLWIAPNLITLLGFAATSAMYFVTASYTPDLVGEAPRWVYLANAVALFFYMTMDNLDGKQARRTKSSSPLGQLFDHGCDALQTILSGLTACATMQTGTGWITVAFIVISCFVVFFFATWEEYHRKKLVLRFINGPTEGILITVAFHFATFAFVRGHPLSFPLAAAFPELHVNEAVAIISGSAAAGTILLNLYDVTRDVGLQGGSRAEALLQLVPFMSMVTFALLWTNAAGTMHRHPHQFMWLVGLCTATLVNRMILAHLCHMPFRTFNKVLIPVHLASLNALLPKLGLAKAPLVDDSVALTASLVFSAVSFAIYVVGVIHELTTCLGIRCFVIPYPPPEISPFEALARKAEAEDRAAAERAGARTRPRGSPEPVAEAAAEPRYSLRRTPQRAGAGQAGSS
eukprot:tig00021105_g18265.t1